MADYTDPPESPGSLPEPRRSSWMEWGGLLGIVAGIVAAFASGSDTYAAMVGICVAVAAICAVAGLALDHALGKQPDVTSRPGRLAFELGTIVGLIVAVILMLLWEPRNTLGWIVVMASVLAGMVVGWVVGLFIR